MLTAGLSISGGTTPQVGASRTGAGDADGDGAGSAKRDRPLPCLNNNNCTEGSDDNDAAPIFEPTPYHHRMAFVLGLEVNALAERFGIEHVGFLTLTFADHVLRMKEAQRRFHSLNTHVLLKRYRRSICTWERQKSERLHAHLLVVTDADIKTGADFKAFERGEYRSANAALRSEWAFWRATAPAYGFGRTELLPIRSNAEAIARYVGKYIGKQLLHRKKHDKGSRLLRFLGYGPGERRAKMRFGWNSPGAAEWRRKVKAFAKAHGFRDSDEIRKMFGPRWAFLLRVAIGCTEIGADGNAVPRGVLTYHPANQNAS